MLSKEPCMSIRWIFDRVGYGEYRITSITHECSRLVMRWSAPFFKGKIHEGSFFPLFLNNYFGDIYDPKVMIDKPEFSEALNNWIINFFSFNYFPS